MIVRMWLTILRPPGPEWYTINHGCSSELYWRDIETGALPSYDPRDGIHLHPPEDPDDGETGGPTLWGIRRRHLAPSGRWNVELPRIVIDPGDRLRQTIAGDHEYHPWWTATDPDPVPALLAAGWREYHRDENIDA